MSEDTRRPCNCGNPTNTIGNPIIPGTVIGRTVLGDDFRYINEDGEFIDVDGHRIDKDGLPVVEFSPFLDDEGNPIVDDIEAIIEDNEE